MLVSTGPDHAKFGNVLPHTEGMINRLFRKTDRDWAPLHVAAHHGFHRVAERLINTCSQDVNMCGSDFSTPLHIASQKGWFMVVQVLLKHHEDVDTGGQRYSILLCTLHRCMGTPRLLYCCLSMAQTRIARQTMAIPRYVSYRRQMETRKLHKCCSTTAQIRMLGPSPVRTHFMRHSGRATVVSQSSCSSMVQTQMLEVLTAGLTTRCLTKWRSEGRAGAQATGARRRRKLL
jgi:hypothetical protein